MKLLYSVILTTSMVFIFTGEAFAQDTSDAQGTTDAQDTTDTQDTTEVLELHPYFGDKFFIQLGMFRPRKEFTLRVDGTSPGNEIDFEQEVGASDTETTGSMNFRWRFGEKWSFWGQYWGVGSDGSWILEDDLVFDDVTFKAGSGAASGMDITVARIFFGRTFFSRPNQEFGIGAGFHWLEVDAYLEGQILSSEGDLVFDRESVNAAFPLPNIGMWYAYTWSPRWMVQARIDWLSASIGDYSGDMLNVQAGVNFQVSRHFGIGLALNSFLLNVDVDKSEWKGSLDTEQTGPFLSFEFNW